MLQFSTMLIIVWDTLTPFTEAALLPRLKCLGLHADFLMRQTAIRLPDEIFERLKDLSGKTGRTTAYYIREAIEEYLADLEDVYLSEQALERLRRGKERTYTLEEVGKELGLAG